MMEESSAVKKNKNECLWQWRIASSVNILQALPQKVAEAFAVLAGLCKSAVGQGGEGDV